MTDMVSSGQTLEALNSSVVESINSGNYAAATDAYRQIIGIVDPLYIVIGDSHVFAYRSHRLLSVWLGPVTMYRIGRDNGKPVDLAALGITPDRVVAFAFGEIDARQHIHQRAAERHISYEDFCEELVDAYLDAIAVLTEAWDKKNVFVATTVPPHEIPTDSPHAFVNAPPLETRIATARALNDCLRMKSASRSYAVVDLYGLFTDERGVLPDDFTDDDIHIYAQPGRERLSSYLQQTFAPSPMPAPTTSASAFSRLLAQAFGKRR